MILVIHQKTSTIGFGCPSRRKRTRRMRAQEASVGNMTGIIRTRRFAAVLLCIVLALAFALPMTAYAQKADAGDKTVRVGWYDSPFNLTDQFGRRSGYAYEYQRKIAAYTGWNYEYVEGSWSELLQKLAAGEIDLMSDVSFKEDRADKMLYASLPMGTEVYYLFILRDNDQITSENYGSLNGKRVGVTKGSVQEDLFNNWAKTHGVKVDLVELTTPEDESLKKLLDGSLDAFITLDAYDSDKSIIPLCKIGSSDFFFTVNAKRPDLLSELDAAMSRIQDENRYYNEQMYEKYLRGSSSTLYLSNDELAWLSRHGTIRVGYQDNYLAFCASDENTGELTGALKDYLAYASTGLENATLDFEPVAYPTAAAALEALKNGEVDCMFPANLTDCDGEQMGVTMTPPLMRTEMDAVVRASEQKEFVRKEQVTVAVNEGNTNYEMFLLDHYPGWKIAYFPDTPAGLEGVAEGKADCVIISNYRYSNIAKQCEKLHLDTVYTGVDMDYCLAVRQGDTHLYSILSRVTGLVPESTVNAALTYYSTEDAKISFVDLVKDNLFIVMTVIAVVLLAILLLLLRSIRAEKKAREEEHLVNDLNKRVFVDALTSVRNKGAYADYIEELQGKLDDGQQIEFAIGVFDCDDLKQVNDQYGHDKGDEYLKVASRLICHVFAHSPVFRIGGDEFSAVLQNEDFQNREQLIVQFEQACNQACTEAENEWEKAHVSAGVAVYDPEHDRSAIDTARRADKVMYENKRLRKEARR